MQDTNRRTFLRAAGFTGAGLALAGTAAGQETTTEGQADGDDAGLVTVESDDDFDATVERIRSALKGNENVTLLTTVDHAENADSAGMELPPTTLFLFGNPQLGTQLMQDTRSVGIDLPQKMLVWEADGAVNVTYNDPAWIAERHDLDAPGMIVQQVSSLLESVATGE